MAKKNYAAICNSIIAVCGGENNISRISHCMTRLRVQLLDGSKLNREEAGKIPGVLNLVVQNGEYQFVIGQDVPNLYAEFIKHEGLKTGGEVTDAAALKQDTEAKKGNLMNTIMSFIGGTFSPVIPVLIAGGLTGAVLTLLTAFFGVSTESDTYTVIYAINQATFYFLPIFIGFSAANRLKSNGFLGAFLGAILLFSTINNAEGLNFLGIPIQQISYNSTVFPVILGVLFMAVVYRFLSKVVPVYLRTIFVPLITMLITVPVTLIVLGPIGNLMGTWLANGVFAIYRAAPPVAVMIIGITLVGLGGPLLHQGGEAADEVDPRGLGGVVHGHGEGDVAARLRRPGHQGHGGDGDAFVDDGDAELPLNGLAGGHQVLGPAGDLVIDLLTGGLWIGIGAVQQGDAHGNGTHVQMLLVDHMYGIQNFVGVDQVNSS